ncbi:MULTISPECIES: hypothetical protein [Amycolatopsis]|uniref:hypothetical protein n=1 Tax=Amycolatopsis TaxID=1813 RepID=UPI00117863D2|nr:MULTISPECIES: hypothetical protein [Amycolatopsis]
MRALKKLAHLTLRALAIEMREVDRRSTLGELLKRDTVPESYEQIKALLVVLERHATNGTPGLEGAGRAARQWLTSGKWPWSEIR